MLSYPPVEKGDRHLARSPQHRDSLVPARSQSPFSTHCRAWLVGLLLFSLVSPSMVSADIFEWEWVDPADHSLGKQPSTTVVPDGAGLVPEPGLDASSKNFTKAFLADYDLSRANFYWATLTNADLSGANLTSTGFYHTDLDDANLSGTNISSSYFGYSTLTNANLSGANISGSFFDRATLTNADLSGANISAHFSNPILTDVDFTGANIRGAIFSSATGFTAAQLYSTASYQAGDLVRLNLYRNDLTSWDFAGKNLTDARFANATLTDADFSGANILGTSFDSTTGFTAAQLYSTASYQAGDLTGVGLAGIDLTDWDFTDVKILGAGFDSTNGFTAAQLYSTTSYQAGDLTGIGLARNDLTDWNFGGKDIADARFNSANLTDVNLSGANISNSVFDRTTLTNTDLTGADARTAWSLDTSPAVTHNFIHPNGHVEGLNIIAGEVMRLWDFDPTRIAKVFYRPVGDIPIFVEDAMTIDSDGTLRVVFEDDAWGSILTFDAGIGVSLDGTLELLVDPHEGSDVFSMVGTTFDLFDWTGVTPSGTFSQIITSAGLTWDTSQLYTTGEVTLLAAIPEPSSGLLLLCTLVGWARIRLLTRS